MKRGIVRIVLGLILITLQIMSVIGNHMSGAIAFSPPVSSAQLLYDLIFYSSYYSIGIIGLILLISGLFAYIRSSSHLSDTTCDSESSIDAPKLAVAADTEPQQVEESVHVPTPTPAPVKQKKQRIFCKYCGQLIDQNTKKCIGCGKQYSHLPKINKTRVVLWIVIILFVAIIGICLNQTNQYRLQITSLDAQISNLNSQIVQLNIDLETANQLARDKNNLSNKKSSEIANLERELSNFKADRDFINQHFVFVANNGTRKYHHFDCTLFKINTDSFSFDVYKLKNAKDQGYKPCSVCIK